MVRALRVAGVPANEAATQAEVLLEGDLRGHPSHGVRRLPMLLQRIQNGVARPGVKPDLEWATRSVVRINGRGGLGAVVSRIAIEVIGDRAGETGIAMACVSQANHVGMLAPYLESLAERDLIGIGLSTSEALVHPWGGSQALVGTNPIGIATPSGRDGESVVLDMSTAAVSRGKILDHGERGLPIPKGWAVDDAGEATTDPHAAHAISPFGGPKGFALGLLIELLVSRLTGTSLGTNVLGTLDATEPVTKGDVFIAVSPERLGLTEQSAVITAYLDQLRASSAVTETPVLIPGDRARATRQKHLREGISVSTAIWQQVQAYSEHNADRE